MTDLADMARNAHRQQLESRQDGGPGSGPRMGQGKGLPSNKKKLTIQQAASTLADKGYKLGLGSSSPRGTTFEVSKGGKTTQMTPKQITALVFSDKTAKGSVEAASKNISNLKESRKKQEALGKELKSGTEKSATKLEKDLADIKARSEKRKAAINKKFADRAAKRRETVTRLKKLQGKQ